MSLTTNEKKLIADALNGCNLPLEYDAHYLQMMAGSEGGLIDARLHALLKNNPLPKDTSDRIAFTGIVCSGLEHEIYDAIRLNRLDEKWKVDGRGLLNKIAEMSVAQREVLLKGVAGVWARLNEPGGQENFDRDLIALEV